MAINLDELRQRLKDERERLIEEIEQSVAEASRLRESGEGSPFGKKEEEAEVTFEMGKRAALDNHLRNQLREVEHALQKFDQGTYGLCDRCGKPIDPARLEALPQATLCLDCKAQQTKDDKSKFPPR